MVENSGKSESTFIREIILDAEKKESQSFNKGYSQGFNQFAIPCFICGETMRIDLKTDTVAQKLIKDTFGKYAHTECVENQKRQQEAEQKAKFQRMFEEY